MQAFLNKLDNHLAAKRAAYYATLQPGLSTEEIAALEKEFNVTIPADLRALYQWKNGQRDNSYEAFVNNSMFLSLEHALATAKEHTSMIGFDFELENWWHPAWIPVFDNGGGDCICYDTAGVFTGIRGQIIEFWHADNDRNTIAPDLTTFIISLNHLYDTTAAADFDEYFEVKAPDGYPKGNYAGEAE
ncbi:SMI1/KNR4 family protein [Chitinophaga sp. CF418]|uniref:SMI1/KNR4 family protein n=1 Tax=Chitinophaga sp. CF418 TaxID=1855287 RepID=UPI000921ADC5|nr:SMI1/KNR4 family protein [Chitinophaga sp. CF418]SHN39920.1 Cell wall assembly regulator SMI1 [Chitinophaga sp. CF418]